jgi:hypothetical protein
MPVKALRDNDSSVTNLRYLLSHFYQGMIIWNCKKWDDANGKEQIKWNCQKEKGSPKNH